MPILSDLGYDLIEIALAVSHGRRTLRVFINKREGITLEDCARASKSLGPALDEHEILRGRYYLEVSSPGAERKLRGRRDFEQFVGRKAHIRLKEAYLGMRQVKGTIDSLQDDLIRIRSETGSTVDIALENISRANLCL